MTRSLGQAVAIQRLALDEEAVVSIPSTQPEVAGTQEYEQNGKPQPVRSGKPFSPRQERGRRARPKHVSPPASGMKWRQKEGVTSGTPAGPSGRQPDGFPSPERSYSGKGRHGRRGAGKQSSFGRTTRKHEAPVVAATAPQRRTARSKPRATPEARVRRAAASNRSARHSHFSHKTWVR